MVGFSFVAKGTGNRDAGTGNRDAISLPRSLDSKLPSILIASRFPLPAHPRSDPGHGRGRHPPVRPGQGDRREPGRN